MARDYPAPTAHCGANSARQIVWIDSYSSGTGFAYPENYRLRQPAPQPALDRSRRRLTRRVADFARALRRWLAVRAAIEHTLRFVRAELERWLHAAPKLPPALLQTPHARCCSVADRYRVRGPPRAAHRN